MPEAISSDSAARMARVPREVRHVHLIGVAGTAMAALAGMLAERGYRVTGSDNQLYEPTASLLKRFADRGCNTASARRIYAGAGPGRRRQRRHARKSRGTGAARVRIPYLSMPETLWHFFLAPSGS